MSECILKSNCFESDLGVVYCIYGTLETVQIAFVDTNLVALGKVSCPTANNCLVYNIFKVFIITRFVVLSVDPRLSFLEQRLEIVELLMCRLYFGRVINLLERKVLENESFVVYLLLHFYDVFFEFIVLVLPGSVDLF